MDIREFSLRQLSEALEKKELSSEEITRAYLEAIERDETSSEPIHAYVSVYTEDALAMAQEADKKRARGEGTKLTGIPIAIKDNINVRGYETTCSSRILKGYKASYDATVVEKLIRHHGMVFLGKTNMDEFAMGSSTETSAYGITRNPFDRKRVPGGSSGGSAASVGGKLAPVALGSDTGGSIRQPAAFCGCVGLKPTYGTVSRYGLVAFASSLDQIGPLARTVEDAAWIYEAIAGHDPRDSTSVEHVPVLKLEGNLKGVRIGVPKEFIVEGMSQEVKENLETVLRKLEQEGAIVKEISLPHSEYAVPTYYVVATAEASSNLERYDGVKYGYRAQAGTLSEMYVKTRTEGFGAEVKRRIMLGTYVLSAGYYDAYYLKALKVRTLIRQDFQKAFAQVDVILGPTTPTPPFGIGEKLNDPISMYLSDIYTISANLAGIPAISLPSGWTKTGLPLGIQLMGDALNDGKLLDVAYGVEQKLKV
ncbi:Asp-tRNA(Asn)/Glu-tRNA(Gln) amidotransferase subunit GatA [Thermospira aquatica]|uniref:Glutamyl-tRNA(Gln) amidotransferase subunit A n=1 Tax=Thermospira aquatica TaxID=2828656 RepID=A0AAX3BFT4_9SPIR|nr:Asp-tRNA(Asn)/Glu-tRNA(Gln) amidotransferase subunit GatA [Thermospira aquatica]URA11233.1 Asp-tRNA(Asn)/Glu-tRNA(Gln) amidotransferase subunit GatA [Thermospira aquatica]